jgi:hypothetical protein
MIKVRKAQRPSLTSFVFGDDIEQMAPQMGAAASLFVNSDKARVL